MALPAIADDWPDEIAEAARPFMTCTGIIFDPSSSDTEPAVLYRGVFRVQHIRQPREFSTGLEWGTHRYYRFQADYDSIGDLYIRKGFRIRVESGGRDTQLEKLTFEVTFATNSSQRAVRTIETVTDGIETPKIVPTPPPPDPEP